MRGMATVGGFSEYIRIPDCEVGYSVLKIDNDIPLRSAVLVEPFVIGTREASSLSPGTDKTAVVFGAGIIGMSAAIMLKWYGCPKVTVVDVSEPRLKNAHHLQSTRKLGVCGAPRNPSVDCTKYCSHKGFCRDNR
jgi:threonine dehydrogenase-like Zn-dependent dehydrogenase